MAASSKTSRGRSGNRRGRSGHDTGRISTPRNRTSGDGPRLELFAGASPFSFDPEEAVRTLRAADRELGALIERVGPFRMQVDEAASVFGAIAQSIAYQQLTGKAAATIFGRVTALCAPRGKGITAERVLAVSEAELRSAGLSTAKMLSLKDLARRTVSRELPTLEEAHALDEETLVARLTEVRGVGRWTAEMFLMFRLGRPDVLPAFDYGIRKGFQAAFRKRTLPAPKDIERRGERWRPFRTVASWYLWRAAELARDAARGA